MVACSCTEPPPVLCPCDSSVHKGQVVVHPPVPQPPDGQAGGWPSGGCLPAGSSTLQAARGMHPAPHVRTMQAQFMSRCRSSTCRAVSHCASSTSGPGCHLPALQAQCNRATCAMPDQHLQVCLDFNYANTLCFLVNPMREAAAL